MSDTAVRHVRRHKEQVVILAGGLGTRLGEVTEVKPKPMVEIGQRPILWHIMKHYAHYGFSEFYVLVGYRGELIKQFFLDYRSMSSDVTVRLKAGTVEVHGDGPNEDWTVHLVDTGIETNTGGRLKRLGTALADTFLLTYGDGVSNINLDALLSFHRRHGKLGTISAVRPPSRFGGLVLDGDAVVEFQEKPQIGEGWINGGFMVLEPEVLRYLDGDDASLEDEALTRLSFDGQLQAYRHEDFWQCMDTLREVKLLENLWVRGDAPWKCWR